MTLGTAFITGATTCIGETYADRLARRGYDIILAGSDGAKLQILADRLRIAADAAVQIASTGFTCERGLLELEAHLLSGRGIAMLVNVAGGAAGKPLSAAEPAASEAIGKLNAPAFARIAAAAAARFAIQGSGTIINIPTAPASMMNRLHPAHACRTAYGLGLSELLSGELAEYGVRVQCVAPGPAHAETWARGAESIEGLSPATIARVRGLVDAALAGLDRGESLTTPSLVSLRAWPPCADTRVGPHFNSSAHSPRERYRARLAVSAAGI